jgi:hypothetical protein
LGRSLSPNENMHRLRNIKICTDNIFALEFAYAEIRDWIIRFTP